MEYIRDQIESIRVQIDECAKSSGRKTKDITLMAVTKTHPVEKIIYAREECNMHCFGENRVQELQQKYKELNIPDELHFIGHLQSNKVKKVLELTNHIDSVDTARLLEKIEKAAAEKDMVVSVLFEYNTSKEEAKSGFTSRDELVKAIEKGFSCKHIEMKGLMTVGPLVDDERTIRSSFKELRGLYYDIIKRFPEIQFDTISMGMSSDYLLAIEEGSTMVRVGTKIFGKRENV